MPAKAAEIIENGAWGDKTPAVGDLIQSSVRTAGHDSLLGRIVVATAAGWFAGLAGFASALLGISAIGSIVLLAIVLRVHKIPPF